VIVKGGGVIEQLGRARSVLFDKTGTLTLGLAAVDDVAVFDGTPPAELLRLAASVDQLSVHALAEALVHDAERRGLQLSRPTDVEEGPGRGVEGIVDGRRIAVGSLDWLVERGYRSPPTVEAGLGAAAASDSARVVVGVDGAVAGCINLTDRVRDDAGSVARDLRREGIRHVAMVTGDRRAVADAVGAALDLDRVDAELSPEAKLGMVKSLRARPDLVPVVMVGDGLNDAPALAAADVGIAMGAGGATVSSETADAVIALDRIDRVVDAIRIGRRSLAIARQSVLAGMALSFAAMVVAAGGALPPVFGALLQEAIDVAVIVNALRALRDPGSVLRRAEDR
jgi:cation transport ATPase